jgi:phage terminase large subunit-like protein
MQSFIYFTQKDTIEKRSKDRVPYQYWADIGYIIATPGNVIDYDIIEETINTTYHLHKVIRLEYRPLQCHTINLRAARARP